MWASVGLWPVISQNKRAMLWTKEFVLGGIFSRHELGLISQFAKWPIGHQWPINDHSRTIEFTHAKALLHSLSNVCVVLDFSFLAIIDIVAMCLVFAVSGACFVLSVCIIWLFRAYRIGLCGKVIS